MGIFDKAKDLLKGHSDKVEEGVDKAADVVDDKTGGKYSEQVDQGAEVAKDKIDDALNSDSDPA